MKPANILTKRDLEIKVSDFGAAQLARSDVTQVSGVGSPAYMSPEQLKGEEIDFRSDMFSVGGVLYDLLAGLPPFHRPHADQPINVVSTGECCGEMAYARREGGVRSATVTALEPTWAMRMRVGDIDSLSEGCRARFNEAFLAIMAERLAMLGGRLVAM